MKTKQILRITIITILTLLIPFTAMKVTDQINWDQTDFLVLGTLILVIATAYEIVLSKIANKTKKLAAVSLLFLVALWIYVELAVGVFTNWGS